jgi:uncharacterized protein (DUF58 family)
MVKITRWKSPKDCHPDSTIPFRASTLNAATRVSDAMAKDFKFDHSYRSRLLALPLRIKELGGGTEGIVGRAQGGRLHFREHRSYVPGDDLRDLDWNLVLRLGILATKQYTREETPEIVVLLDRSASMGAGDLGKDRSARELAGGIASVVLHAQAPFTLSILSEGGPVTLGRWVSHRKLDACVRAIETLGWPDGPTHLAGVRDLQAPLGQGRVAFLISDFLAEPFPAELCSALRRGNGSGAFVHVVSQREYHPMRRNRGVFCDLETGAHCNYERRPDLLQAYTEELTRHEAFVESLARRHGLGFIPHSDSQDFETTVTSAFCKGATRGVS